MSRWDCPNGSWENEVSMTEVNHSSKIAEIIEAYPVDQRFALAAMQDMQHAFNYIPEEGLAALAEYLACHLRGAMNLATELKRDLGIEPGETTEDGEFSVELVNCLGSCALAPVMVVDGNYHNKLRVEQIPGIIESYAASGAEEVTAND